MKKKTVDRTWGGGGSTKTRLAPQTNGDAMTSTWLGKSRELYEILTGGQLHRANVSPASPRPSLNKTIHKERKGHKNPISREIFYLSFVT